MLAVYFGISQDIPVAPFTCGYFLIWQKGKSEKKWEESKEGDRDKFGLVLI